MTTEIDVLIPSYNCRPWIERTLASVAGQTHAPRRVLLIDDASPDPEYSKLAQARCAQYGFDFVRNVTRQQCPKNLWLGIQRLAPHQDGVIFLLDGDDFLPLHALARIAQIYDADPRLLLTYGNYVPHPEDTGQTRARAYPPHVIRTRGFRRAPGGFNHPLTFRKSLWDQLTIADLTTRAGTWFRGGYDLVIMMPMLELAAPHRFRFVDEVIYFYNSVNPESDSHVNRDLVEESREVLARPPKRRS